MLQKIIEIGKKKGIISFSANVDKENIASNALLTKLGFQIQKDNESFRKQGTDIIYSRYTYPLKIH